MGVRRGSSCDEYPAVGTGVFMAGCSEAQSLPVKGTYEFVLAIGGQEMDSPGVRARN